MDNNAATRARARRLRKRHHLVAAGPAPVRGAGIRGAERQTHASGSPFEMRSMISSAIIWVNFDGRPRLRWMTKEPAAGWLPFSGCRGRFALQSYGSGVGGV